MIKFTAFVILVAIRIAYQPSPAQNTGAFADPAVISQPPANVIELEGSRTNNKAEENNNCAFYETNNQNNTSYRIKMINKNNQTEFSSIVVIRKA